MALQFTILLWLIPLFPLILWLCKSYYDSIYSIWKKRGIPYVPGSFPFGSSRGFTMETEFTGEIFRNMSKQFPKEPYFGFFQGAIPTLVVKDPEMVRVILAKEFSHFRDRQGNNVFEDDHLSKNLFNLEGDIWRALRIKLSPVFTSGKLKAMFPLFVKCSEALENLLVRKLDSIFDVKDIAARFNTDIICSCAFGLEVDSINNSEAVFRVMGKKMLDAQMSLLGKLKVNMKKFFPVLESTTMPRAIPKEVEDFMVNTVMDTVAHREKSGQSRNDFIDLLIQLRDKGVLTEENVDKDELGKNIKPIELTAQLMTAQCFAFFAAGFETSASVQSFCFYELAFNPDIQERLHEEIETTIEKHGGITYQAVQEMVYLDMVVKETLRKYPTLLLLTRRCTIPLTTPHGHKIEKGDRIILPVWAMHHDPELFPEPEKFNPERFSPENKSSIRPYSYIPFGEGPRICIGERFGLLQTKMGIITILRKFRLSPGPETQKNLEYQNIPLVIRTKSPIILEITKRT